MRLRVGVVLLALTPQAAAAHGTLAGGGGFYAGIEHPFLAWEHTILLIGLGLLLGRLGRMRARLPLCGLLIGLGAGLIFGPALGFPGSGVSILLLAMLAGAIVVLMLPVPMLLLAVLMLMGGVAVGLDTGVPPPPDMTAIELYAPYLGVVVGVFLIVLNVMALASLATRPPYTIAVRMVGSWIIAIAMMVLALHLRQITGAV
ncbi:HupE/UreJ family protein [Cypionkella psychrotolerans]|uniref:HupE/UreJ family protein n=1 Tax=Cypionkella psychrotolerans TaxID=1678131 RepID=UPI0006B4628F|nr:HupE/UreJ family protein [Cypionkella psychrotolerans]